MEKLDKTLVPEWLVKKGNYVEILEKNDKSWSDDDLYIVVSTPKALGIGIEPNAKALFWIPLSQYKK